MVRLSQYMISAGQCQGLHVTEAGSTRGQCECSDVIPAKAGIQLQIALSSELQPAMEQYDFDTMLLAASIRNPLHVVTAAMAGAHIATVPYGVLEQMIRHPLTDAGIDKFLADWGKLQG